jgi:nicotinamide-nucleotide amidase
LRAEVPIPLLLLNVPEHDAARNCELQGANCRKISRMRELVVHAERVAVVLKARNETVAVAESSAGGLITAALLAVPGASAWCLGGAVIYTTQAWGALRDFSPELLGGFRSATEGNALARARIIRERFGASWGLAETGAAGPSGNRYGDPAGHACVAVSGRGERALTLRTGSAGRLDNMHAFAAAALQLFVEVLES